MKVWRHIRAEEDGRRLDLTREPDPGFARKAYDWARGEPLERILGDEDAPGDFVRTVKQLLDLLRQIGEITPPGPLADAIDRAEDGLMRGVIAYSPVDL